MKELNETNFNAEVLSCNIPVLVDFWAAWCGPCKKLAPVIQQIESETAGRVKVCKVNIDEQPQLAAEYGIVSIPTLIVFENGEVKCMDVGYMDKKEILQMLD